MEHDRKGVQIGAINYSNRTVSSTVQAFEWGSIDNGPKQLSYQLLLFYDGPELPEGFYDDFLNLPNSAKIIIQDDFVKFMSYLVLPVRER